MNNLDPISELKKFIGVASPYLKSYHNSLKASLEFASGAQNTKEDEAIVGAGRANLVFNFVGRYCEDVINQYRRKPYGVVYSARRQEAKEQITKLNGIIKGWQATSDFKSATVNAVDRQVKCGLGYVKLSNEYVSETEGFEQSIAITALMRPDMVIFDPYSFVTDGADAKKCAIVEHISKDAAMELGLDEGECNPSDSPVDGSAWVSPEGFVPLITFYVLHKEQSKIYMSPEGNTVTEGTDEMKSRSISKSFCMVHRIVGSKVIDSIKLPISRIPIIPFRGKLIDRDNRQEWVGEVHDAKDPARMINWAANLGAERMALAPKATRYVDFESIADFKAVWQRSNRQNVPYLPYRSKIGDKQFNAPVTDSPNVDITTPLTAQTDYRNVLSGILGANEAGTMAAGASNETAASVLTRANSSENSKFVYADNASKSVVAIGKVWLEMAGITLDTPRAMPVEMEGDIDIQEIDFKELGIVPSEVDCAVESGPLSDTQRKESLNALLALGSMLGPEAALTFASNIAKNCDFEDSDEVAAKLAAYSKSVTGIGDSADDMEDPEAVKALQAGAEALAAVQAQLEQANVYIQQLQMQNYVNEQGFQVDRETALINAQNRIDVEAMKQDGSLTQQQMKIQADAELATQKQQAEVAKAFASSPKITVIDGMKPDYNSIGGMRNDLA